MIAELLSTDGRAGRRTRRGRRAVRRRAVRVLPRARGCGPAQGSDGLNCFTWVAGEDSAEGADGPLAGVPLAVKDLFCTKGVPSQSGSKILEGYLPPYTATAVDRLAEGGGGAARKDQPGRVRDGLLERELGLRAGRATRGTAPACRAAPRAGAPPPSRPGWRPGRSAPTRAARSASRRRCAASSGMKPTYGSVSRYGMIAFASSLDQAGPLTRDVRDAALLLREMAGQDPCDATSLQLPEPVALPSAERLDGVRIGVPGRAVGRGHRSGRARVLPRRARDSPSRWAPRSPRSRCRTPRTRSPPTTCWRPPRRPRTSRASTASATGCARPTPRDLLDMYTRTRHDGFGPEVKRRIMLGTYALSSRLLRRLLRARPARAHEDRRGLREGIRRDRPDRDADRSDRRLRARREDRRPARDVPQRLLHGADVAGRDPGDLDPLRALRTACRSACSSPGRRSARTRCSTPSYALEQALGFDGSGARG